MANKKKLGTYHKVSASKSKKKKNSPKTQTIKKTSTKEFYRLKRKYIDEFPEAIGFSNDLLKTLALWGEIIHHEENGEEYWLGQGIDGYFNDWSYEEEAQSMIRDGLIEYSHTDEEGDKYYVLTKKGKDFLKYAGISKKAIIEEAIEESPDDDMEDLEYEIAPELLSWYKKK